MTAMYFHRNIPTRDLHSFPTRRSSDLNHLGQDRLSGGSPRREKREQQQGQKDAAAHYRPNCRRLEKWCVAFKRRSEEHTSELQSRFDLVCRLLLEKKTTP